MVKLRLMRMGKKKQPTYRVVAAESRKARNGRFIEIVGTYEPRRDPSVIQIDNDKAVAWLQKGAQPTERVEKLLKISGAWEQFTGEAPAPAPAARSKSEKKQARQDESTSPASSEAAAPDAAATEAAGAEAPDEASEDEST